MFPLSIMNALHRPFLVVLVNFVAYEPSPTNNRCDSGGPAAHKRIVYDFVFCRYIAQCNASATLLETGPDVRLW